MVRGSGSMGRGGNGHQHPSLVKLITWWKFCFLVKMFVWLERESQRIWKYPSTRGKRMGQSALDSLEDL